MKFVELVESLDTKFDQINWKQIGLEFQGIGLFQGHECRLSIMIHFKSDHKYLSLSFSFVSDEIETFELVGHANFLGLKLISCVTHALIAQVKTEMLSSFRVYVMQAENNTQKRLNLYHRIAKKMSSQLRMQALRHDTCVVMFLKSVEPSLIKDILDSK